MARISTFVLTVAVALLVAPWISCGGSRHDVDETYFLVTVNTKIPYWQAARAGFAAAGDQLKVKYDVVGPDTYDPRAERDEFQRLVRERKPSGIVISPADPAMMQPEIDAAIGRGVPVITIDSDAPSSKRLFFIGTDNYDAGVLGGNLAAKTLGGKGNVVVFTMPEQANLKERMQGYEQAFRAYPGIHIVERVDIKGDPRIAFDRANDILEKGKPAVDAFVCLEALACPEVAEVLSRRNVKGKVVVAMDTDQRTLEWIQKGMIVATIAQKPYTMASFGLKVLDDLFHNKLPTLARSFAQDIRSPLPTFVDTGTVLVDKNNVEQFMKQPAGGTGQ